MGYVCATLIELTAVVKEANGQGRSKVAHDCECDSYPAHVPDRAIGSPPHPGTGDALRHDDIDSMKT